MSRLVQTEAMLADLSALELPQLGGHYGNDPSVGVPGRLLAEIPYNPAQHLPTHINPLSVMGQATDQLYVREVLPRLPLSMRVITQHSRNKTDSVIDNHKLYLAERLKDAISEAVPHTSDKVFAYHVGNSGEVVSDYDTDFIEVGDDSEAAIAVADLCRDGLAFVISDFSHLPLHEVENGHFEATVGIKVNHPSDLGFLPDGVYALGGEAEADTRTVKGQNDANVMLANYDNLLKTRMKQAGLVMAQVVLDHRYAQASGFDISAADESIAQAIRQATTHLA